MENMRVSREWASRPNDQRFLTLADLHAKVQGRRDTSRTEDVALDMMQVRATEGGSIALGDAQGARGILTHWAFSQLCARAKAPAGYLRTMPADLAVIPLQWSLEKHETTDDEGNDGKLLVRQNGDTYVAAVTSPTYGRIWDADVVRALTERIDTSIWQVPAASYSGTNPLKATTLYASDRDVFVFLVNESNPVEVDGEVLKRGFYVYNSEVGSATFGIATFTYDRVCDNRIIWGQRDFKELKIRHTSGGPHRFVANAVPRLSAYAESSAAGLADTIRRAKATEVAKDREGVTAWLKARGFTAPLARKAWDAAEADPRGYNPRSVWGLVQGLTDTAHDMTHTDTRTDLEAKAGGLLEALAE